MKRTLVLLSLMGAAVMILGCGSDPAEDTINKILAQSKEASAKMSDVRAELDKVVKDAKKGKRKIDETHLDEVIARCKDLKKVGEKLMGLKVAAQELRAKVDEDKRAQLTDQYSEKVGNAVSSLNSELESLQEAANRAEELASSAKVRETVRLHVRGALEEFAALTRRQ